MTGKNDDNKVYEAGSIDLTITTDTEHVSYTSAFATKQLKYAKRARDKVGSIEALYAGRDMKLLPEEANLDHQQNAMLAVVSSIAFLDGKKNWFIHKLKQGTWDFENQEQMLNVNSRNGIEDWVVCMASAHGNGGYELVETDLYKDIRAIRRFRNNLIHFDTVAVESGKEGAEYNADQLLTQQKFSHNPIGANNSYPFKWFSHDLAERSVRESRSLWSWLGMKISKEDELMSGVPSYK